MWVNAFIKHKTCDLHPCKMLFKYGKIQEVEFENFKGITPFLNNSVLSDNIEILKCYKTDSTNGFCKYFIKKSIDNEVFITYLNISKLNYFKLKWQLKNYAIQSKELKVELIKSFIIGSFGFFVGFITEKFEFLTIISNTLKD